MTKKLIYIVLLTISFARSVAGDEIDISVLGALELSFQQAITVDSYPGQNIAAEVGFKKGAGFTLVAPRLIQQINYLVEPGSMIEQGQPLAELVGSEIHHFLTEMNVAKQIFEVVKRRFDSNRILYKKRAIKESQWVDISERYYAAQLEYEHLRHFNDLVISTDTDNDRVIIGAPISGVVDYSLQFNSLKPDDDIAIIVPALAIRLEAAIPTSARSELAYLKASSCRLQVSSISSVAKGFFVTVWTEPLKPECDFILGERFLVTPFYKAQAYKVPMSAVIQWKRVTSILVRDGKKLQVREVLLLASSGSEYIITTGRPLQNSEVLVSSVSAVQGLLLGMGGE